MDLGSKVENILIKIIITQLSRYKYMAPMGLWGERQNPLRYISSFL